ncbi:MAG: carbohydrate kinase [Alphaproteobacteria bacterium]|nr:carbohydrate kinase [Alphaproteobacteria bacterium]
MILCCGEALIDMVQAENGSFMPHCGGAVFNTAIALGRLEASVGMLTGLSNDMFGAQLRQALQASNVTTDYVVTANRPTTLAFVQLVDGQARYHFFDENSAGRMLQQTDMPVLSDTISALYFSGISLVFEPCADSYLALLQQNHQQYLIMLDPNIRPNFIVDRAHYCNRLEKMFALADIIKVSDEDLHWLIPETNLSLEEKAQKLIDKKLVDKGAKLIIVTRGTQDTLCLSHHGDIIMTPTLPAKVIDTIGAGDSFNAGFLAKLSELDAVDKAEFANITPETLQQALHYATKTAAITVSRAGANPPNRAEIA